MPEDIRAFARRQANLCRVFSSTTRVMILWALADCELSVGDIVAASGSTMQNTSKHLRLMKDNGILCYRREANYIFYRIDLDELMNGFQLLQRVLTPPEAQYQQTISISESVTT